MNALRNVILGTLVLAFSGMIWGQASLQTREAELAVPFGSAKGRVLIVADYFVFMDADRPENSFAIPRLQIRSLEWQESLLKVATNYPVEDRTGQRSELVFKFKEPLDLTDWWQQRAESAPMPPAQRAAEEVKTYSVRHNHRFGGCQGRLLISEKGLAFESISDLDHSRKWDYSGIKTVKLENPYSLKLEPFQGNGYNLQIQGQGMESAAYDTLVDRITAARNAP